ncbi:MAG: hypothetical protein PHV62_00150 [Sulfuricurvum sp.]|nr:hypothetical protein [Sulfuricurvum sp.]
MLFNPTPMEKLTSLADDLVAKYNAAKEEVAILREKLVTLHANQEGKDEEIKRLEALLRNKDAELSAKNAELAEKDTEIEAIVSKIESLLG